MLGNSTPKAFVAVIKCGLDRKLNEMFPVTRASDKFSINVSAVSGATQNEFISVRVCFFGDPDDDTAHFQNI